MSALLRRGLEPSAAQVDTSARTGLPVVTIGGVITSADVRALEDDEDAVLDTCRTKAAGRVAQ